MGPFFVDCFLTHLPAKLQIASCGSHVTNRPTMVIVSVPVRYTLRAAIFPGPDWHMSSKKPTAAPCSSCGPSSWEEVDHNCTQQGQSALWGLFSMGKRPIDASHATDRDAISNVPRSAILVIKTIRRTTRRPSARSQIILRILSSVAGLNPYSSADAVELVGLPLGPVLGHLGPLDSCKEQGVASETRIAGLEHLELRLRLRSYV